MTKVYKTFTFAALATTMLASAAVAQDAVQTTTTQAVVTKEAAADGSTSETRAVATETTTVPTAMVATHTVQTIMASPKSGADVTVIGTLGAKVGHEKYAFTDRTGTMTVEIDDEDMPANMTLGQMVRIDGELDWEGFVHRKVQIDADRVTLL